MLTVNLALQTHVPKLASLPHASSTNVTFMSSLSHETPPLPHFPPPTLLLSSRLLTHFPSAHIPADTSPHLLLPLLFLSSPVSFFQTAGLSSLLISSTSCLGVISGCSVPTVCIVGNTLHVNLFIGQTPHERRSLRAPRQ